MNETLKTAIDRICDLLHRDDGQAYKEARRFLEIHAPYRLVPTQEEAEAYPARETVEDLRNRGWCVVMWSPDELREADSGQLEDIVIERGNDYTEDVYVQVEDEEEEEEE